MGLLGADKGEAAVVGIVDADHTVDALLVLEQRHGVVGRAAFALLAEEAAEDVFDLARVHIFGDLSDFFFLNSRKRCLIIGHRQLSVVRLTGRHKQGRQC